jgi:SAM-dependent methyltransferase
LYRLVGASSVVEVGCGHGRLARAFPPECYLGLDINHEAVAKARSEVAAYQFREIDFADPYPPGSLCLAYTVLLHIDDDSIQAVARHMSKTFQRLLIVEIMQRRLRNLPSKVPNYCRNRSDYEQLFGEFELEWEIRKPYRHYQAQRLEMSHLLLCRHE